MLSKRVYSFKNGKSVWLSNFFQNNSIPALPNGKTFTFTPVQANTPSYYLDKGVSFINYNAGSGNFGLFPANKKAIFIFNPQIIRDYNPNKPLRDFSQVDCNNVIDGYLASRQGDIDLIVSGMNEGYNGLENWVQSTIFHQGYDNNGNPSDARSTYAASQQYEWLDRRLVEKLSGHNGRYFGTYDGHFAMGSLINNSGQPIGDANVIRNALQNNSAAYELVKNNSGFGNPYFTQDAFQWRHGLLNTYYAGSPDSFQRITQILLGFVLNKKALNYKNNTSSRTMSFMFPASTEFTDYLQDYRHYTSYGGYLQRFGFPCYSPKLNLIIAYISLALCDDLFGWEDTGLRGTNPDVVYPDTLYDNKFPDAGWLFKYYGNGSPERATSISTFEDGRKYPYPELPRGSGNDAMCEGVQWFSRASAWAGSAISFARHRLAGSSTWCSLGDTYVLDRYQQNQPIAMIHSSGSRRALFFFDLSSSPGTRKDYEVDVNGGTFTFTAEGGMPYLYLLDQV